MISHCSHPLYTITANNAEFRLINGRELIAECIRKLLKSQKNCQIVKEEPEDAKVMGFVLVRYLKSRSTHKEHAGKLQKRVRMIVPVRQNEDRSPECHFEVDAFTANALTAPCRNEKVKAFTTVKTVCESEIRLPSNDMQFYFDHAFQWVPVEIVNGCHKGKCCFYSPDERYSKEDLNRFLSEDDYLRDPVNYKKDIKKFKYFTD